MFSDLRKTVTAVNVHEHVTIYPLVPRTVGQGWKLELFELAISLVQQKGKKESQILVVMEGNLKISYDNEESIVLQPGELFSIKSGNAPTLVPVGATRFLVLELPIANARAMTFLYSLSQQYVRAKIDLGTYVVYEFINGAMTGGVWSIALLEINDSPRHFHRLGKEMFIVVHGELEIEIDGNHRILGVGESVVVHPPHVHKLKKSTSTDPVQVLCLNFPAFDPADMYGK